MARTTPGPTASGCSQRSPGRRCRSAASVARRRTATRRGTVVDTRAAAMANRPARTKALRNPDVLEHRLADDRTDADAAVHGDREVRRRLGPTIGRAEVGDERHRGDEQGGLAGPGEPAQRRAGAAANRRSRTAPRRRRRATAPPIITRAAPEAHRRVDRSAGARRSPHRRTRRSPGRCPAPRRRSSSSMYLGTSGTSTPTYMKKANVAAVTARKGRVMRRAIRRTYRRVTSTATVSCCDAGGPITTPRTGATSP